MLPTPLCNRFYCLRTACETLGQRRSERLAERDGAIPPCPGASAFPLLRNNYANPRRHGDSTGSQKPVCCENLTPLVDLEHTVPPAHKLCGCLQWQGREWRLVNSCWGLGRVQCNRIGCQIPDCHMCCVILVISSESLKGFPLMGL